MTAADRPTLADAEVAALVADALRHRRTGTGCESCVEGIERLVDELARLTDVVATVRELAEEATERAYFDIALDKMLTIQTSGPGRARVPGHWRPLAEPRARVRVADLRAVLDGAPTKAGTDA